MDDVTNPGLDRALSPEELELANREAMKKASSASFAEADATKTAAEQGLNSELKKQAAEKYVRDTYGKVHDASRALHNAEVEKLLNPPPPSFLDKAKQTAGNAYDNIVGKFKASGPVIEEGVKDIDLNKYKALQASGQLEGQIAKENALRMLGKAGRFAGKVAGPLSLAYEALRPEEANAGSDVPIGQPLSPEQMQGTAPQNKQMALDKQSPMYNDITNVGKPGSDQDPELNARVEKYKNEDPERFKAVRDLVYNNK
jgi:hypothetical protein